MNKRSLMLGCRLDHEDAGLLKEGCVYAFGGYFPKSWTKHWDSSWSQMVLKLKHNDAWTIMVTGQILAAHLDCWLKKGRQYVMTYVPGWNRGGRPGRECTSARLAASILSHLADKRDVSLECLLVQMRRKRKSQCRCRTVEERLRNVRGCYGVTQEVRGQNIILIDDVVTSGATMRKCARVLKQAGANGVICIAMAMTVGCEREARRRAI